ncbi:MAG: sigma-54-dependent Fis family transcriptional regulator [Nitrospirae bacterium]|nr:sigma-54-dependent Fis family transcriptional regulator [Nitrospirota bacterium]
MEKILVVDDERAIVQSIRMLLKDSYEIVSASSADEAVDLFRRERPDLIILDIIMPGISGLEVLKIIREQDLLVPVVVLTATKMVKPAVEAMKMGATDYITKPFDIDELRLIVRKSFKTASLEREVKHLRSELDNRSKFQNIIGKSKAMREIYSKIEQIADTKHTVLITGESGTGKELVASALYFTSSRRDKPYVAINCAAIPDNLIESELFGFEKGAFTDAQVRKAGQFELADGGTLFLDEVGDLALNTQAKLLRVIQEREFTRLGGGKPTKVDVRIIAATNHDLAVAIKNGRFREDLYYRINVISIHLPPLRERREDIPLLAQYFSDKISEENGIRPKVFSGDATDMMMGYDWPGNIRELYNLIEQVSALSDKEIITKDDLVAGLGSRGLGSHLKGKIHSEKRSFDSAVVEFEKEIIIAALKRNNYIQTRTAEYLGITRRVLRYKMDMYNIKTQENQSEEGHNA